MSRVLGLGTGGRALTLTLTRYWGQSESFTDIPLVKLLRLPFTHLSLSVQRLALAGAGVGCALLLHLVRGRGRVRLRVSLINRVIRIRRETNPVGPTCTHVYS